MIVTDVKAVGLEQLERSISPLEKLKSGCGLFDINAKVDLHRFIVELNFGATAEELGRVFRWWLRCPGGEEKQRLMVDRMNVARSRKGWPPCRTRELLHEMRSSLTSSVQDLYEVWLSSVPQEICGKVCDSRSFVNFVAAVVSLEENDPISGNDPDWEVVEKIHFYAAAGGYLLLKPLLPGQAEASDFNGSVNELALYIVEELRVWKCLEVWRPVPGFCLRDLSRAHQAQPQLSDGGREAVERRLTKPTLALCRDLTKPVLRLVLLALRSSNFGACDLGESSKAMESLFYCLYLHGGGGGGEATQEDLESCLQAANDPKVAALAVGECEVGPLVFKMLPPELAQERNLA